MNHASFADTLLDWFDLHGRHDLPWQHPRTPYRVWLSEIMLQQTQVRVAAPYFLRFVDALPDVRALAAAPRDTVQALWSGLGYYARARNLHSAAQHCVEHHGGELPRDLDALIALPGIGRSTAGAILAQAWGDRHAILDGNVKRVLCRLHGIDQWPGKPSVEQRLWAIAHAQLPHARMADYTQAQMDFGATLCTRHKPACALCPLQDSCVARRRGLTDALPVRKPAKTLAQRHAAVLLARDADGRLLLQRRPPTGVWASLWSLPQVALCDDASDDSSNDTPCATLTALDGAIDRAARGLAEALSLTAPRAEADHADHADNAAPSYRIPPSLHAHGQALQPLPPIDHAFSHYRLRLHPQQLASVPPQRTVNDDDTLRWVARSDLDQLGIPAPIRSLLERALATQPAAAADCSRAAASPPARNGDATHAAPAPRAPSAAAARAPDASATVTRRRS